MRNFLDNHGENTVPDPDELIVFAIGCFMLILWVFCISLLWLNANTLWLKILTMGFTELFLGRAAAIAQALHADMNKAFIIFLATYVDGATVFILYPLFVLSYRHLIEQRFLSKSTLRVFASARKSVTRFAHYKFAGVILFVWFPFLMTGVVIGAVLGYLLELKTWKTMVAVNVGNLTAAICWVYLYDNLFRITGRIHKSLPVAVTVIIILALVTYRLITRYREARVLNGGRS